MSKATITDNVSGNLNTSSVGGSGFHGLNRRNIVPIPPRLRNITKFHFIYNISDHRPNPRLPISWTRSMGGLGTWFIWAKEEGELVSKPTVVPEILVNQYDAGIPGGWGGGNLQGRIEYTEQDGLEFCQDLLGILPPVTPDNDLTQWGVFLAKGERPTTQEIDEATEKMRMTYRFVVQDAERLYGNPKTRDEINQVHIRAAKFLLYEAPWCSLPKQMVACPGCGMPVSPIVAFHAGPNGCGTIVNLETAKRLREQEAKLNAEVEKTKPTGKQNVA